MILLRPLVPLLLVVPALLAGQEPVPPYRRADLPVETRVADLLGRMTADEKFWQLYLHPGDSTTPAGQGRFGIQLMPAGTAADAARQLNAVQRRFTDSTRLGIPIIPVAEALHGVVAPGATVFPQAIGLAASWDTTLMDEVATAIAIEASGRGARQVLSPVLNLATDARWGRVEETYGEDPYLAGLMGQAFIHAFETRGIVTTPKHFVANSGDGGRDSYPIELSERRLREVELAPFERALRQAGARSVMAAYNSVDGRPASASAWLLQQVLRRDWQFGGVVLSDAGGVGGANALLGTATDYADATGQAMRAGLDVIFQGDAASAGLFKTAFDRGDIPGPVIDSAVARVLRLKFALGLFDRPMADEGQARQLDADTTHRQLARTAAARAAVLLQNTGGLLPLNQARLRHVALIGTDARTARLGGYSGPGTHLVSALDALRTRLDAGRVLFAPGPGRRVERNVTIPASALRAADGAAGLAAEYFSGPELGGAAVATRTDSVIDFHWCFLPPAAGLDPAWFSARWRGTLSIPRAGSSHLGVVATDGFRVFLADSLVLDAWNAPGPSERLVAVVRLAGHTVPIRVEFKAPGPDSRVRLVWDQGIRDESEAKITEAVQAARRADVAVVMVGLEEGEFRDRASLALPGRQEELIRRVAATGTATVVVIVGGGAVTMRAWLERVAAVLDVWYPGEAGGEALADLLLGDAEPGGRLPMTFPVAEGQLPLNYDHKRTGRGDDYDDLTGLPQFPFGFGLGYTRFGYSDLVVSRDSIGAGDTLVVRCTVRNIGPRTGSEVAQLYLRDPVASVARPVLALKGFERIVLAPGGSATVSFRVPAQDLTLLDAQLRPVLEPGPMEILVGASSRDLRLRGRIIVR